jgi:TonB-dependent starch-binding outer membrane protein SusC
VDVEVKDASVAEVLDICMKNQPLTYTISGTGIVIKEKEVASGKGESQAITQYIDIKGRIVNEKNEPVVSATIMEKGTTNSTTSSDNGAFHLMGVGEDAILVISSIGYETQELKVNGKNDISVRLKIKVSTLEGVSITANTGYQEIPSERSTGSFTVVDNKTLNLQVGTNILDRLDGIASSILFDNTKLKDANTKKLNFNIRGLSTINGSQDPLIILDNFPYEGDINNINPNDIENLTVLKDAAAASIWGAKAGNGVIVITTKKGRFNQPLKVEFNSAITVIGKPDLYYLPQMNVSDYIDVERFLFSKNYFNSQINSPVRPALSPAIEILIRRKSGQISASDSAAQIDALKSTDIRDEFNKYFYRNAITQQYSLNLKGGSENIAWLISGGYNRAIDNLDAHFDKLNVHFENIYKPMKNLEISVGVLYTNSKSKSGRPPYNSIRVNNRQIPYLKFADNDGTPMPVALTLRNSYTDTAGAGKLLDWKYYPLEDYKHNTTTTNLKELLANISLQYQIVKGFSVNFRYQYQNQDGITENLADLESYKTRDLINRFSQIDRLNGIVNYIVPLGNILNTTDNKIVSQNIRGQINFNKTWKAHSLNVIAGAEVRETRSSGKANTIYGYSEDPLFLNASIDFKNSYPLLPIGNAFVPNGASYSDKRNRFVSYFSNASYIFKGKYTISGSFRKDASNLFGLATNDKWNPFWSAGVSWLLSNENFYNNSLFTYLKLRTTYGFTGNVDQSKSAVTIAQTVSTDPWTGYPFSIVTQLGNRDLRWEKVRNLNIGVDFALKDNIISGSIEYYQKKGTDLYGPSPIDYTAGLNQFSNEVIKNVADMVGRGVDLTLHTKNIDKGISWYSDILFNYNISKTTKYYWPDGVTYSGTFGNNISPIIGKPIYSILSYRWSRLDPTTGNPLGYLNKQPSANYPAIFNSITAPDSLAFSGSATPKFWGAIRNTINWKGVSFSFNVTYKLGYYFRKSSISYDLLYRLGTGHSDYAHRWQKPGDELITNVPSMVYPNNARRDQFYLLSEATVVQGDHIRLQFINLSYDLERMFTKSFRFQSLQLYFNIANLGIIWRANKDDIDPDYPFSALPAKTYSVGLRANF